MNGTGDGTVTTHVAHLPGMPKGEVGLAGQDKPGSSIRVVTIPWMQYVGIEVGWVFLNSFLGILGMDGMGLVELAPAPDAFGHLVDVAQMALAPALLMLVKELYDYLGKLRISRQ
jgi:hypothetical protein